MTEIDSDLSIFLIEQGLAAPGEASKWTPLSGGVSSDIWRVDTPTLTFCVKRALEKLKVEADWHADVSRNAYEWSYITLADRLVPGSVPTPIAHDEKRGLFAMAWLDGSQHRLWKTELLEGRIDVAFSSEMGNLLGMLHQSTARDSEVQREFATDANFKALRLDPYFYHTADAHPEVAENIRAIARETAETKLALVHGDVSPKNILIGPDGPVILDAEVAWYGDPAFDVAFCLNHLALKSYVTPGSAAALMDAMDAFSIAYLPNVDWEPRQAMVKRIARLVPALALARIDGKSPVEYLGEEQQSVVRERAVAAIKEARTDLTETLQALSADD